MDKRRRKLFGSEFAADYAMSRELSDYKKDKYEIVRSRRRRLLSLLKKMTSRDTNIELEKVKMTEFKKI